jgi:Zn ribbon nucleic-acid-binding protein
VNILPPEPCPDPACGKLACITGVSAAGVPWRECLACGWQVTGFDTRTGRWGP